MGPMQEPTNDMNAAKSGEYDRPMKEVGGMQDIKPVEAALSLQNELLDNLEKSLVVLADKLRQVSKEDDDAARAVQELPLFGSSELVQKIGQRNYKLQNLNAAVNYMSGRIEL